MLFTAVTALMENKGGENLVVILVVITVMVFLMAGYFVGRKRRRAMAGLKEVDSAQLAQLIHSKTPGSFRERLVERFPLGVFLDPGHTWVFLEESGSTKLGIDAFAQCIIGTIDRIESQPVGENIRKGDVILRLWHGNRTIEFRSPMDGVIDDINTSLLERRDMQEVDHFTDAWLYKIKSSDPSELPKTLLVGQASQNWLMREIERLKVFLATLVPGDPALGQTLLDGGLPIWGLIDHVEDDDWKKLNDVFFG